MRPPVVDRIAFEQQSGRWEWCRAAYWWSRGAVTRAAGHELQAELHEAAAAWLAEQAGIELKD